MNQTHEKMQNMRIFWQNYPFLVHLFIFCGRLSFRMRKGCIVKKPWCVNMNPFVSSQDFTKCLRLNGIVMLFVLFKYTLISIAHNVCFIMWGFCRLERFFEMRFAEFENLDSVLRDFPCVPEIEQNFVDV